MKICDKIGGNVPKSEVKNVRKYLGSVMDSLNAFSFSQILQISIIHEQIGDKLRYRRVYVDTFGYKKWKYLRVINKENSICQSGYHLVEWSSDRLAGVNPWRPSLYCLFFQHVTLSHRMKKRHDIQIQYWTILTMVQWNVYWRSHIYPNSFNNSKRRG